MQNKTLAWGFPTKGRGLNGFLLNSPSQSTLKAAKYEENFISDETGNAQIQTLNQEEHLPKQQQCLITREVGYHKDREQKKG